MTINFEQSLKLLEENRNTLEEDLRRLEEIKLHTEKLADEYKNILSFQEITNDNLKQNLKLVEDIARIIARNLNGIGKGNISNLLREVAKGVLTSESLIKILTSKGASIVNFNNASDDFPDSIGQSIADMAKALQKAQRNL